jgi:hypothetical protein
MHTALQNYLAEDTGSALKFISPYRKPWLTILLLLSEIAVCMIGLLWYLRDPAHIFADLPSFPPFPFLAVLLVVGPLMLVESLWLLCGVEIAEVTDSQIIIKHQILGLGISKSFEAQGIDGVFVSNPRNVQSDDSAREFRFINFRRGIVAINYGKTFLGGPRTYRFGSMLGREDAKRIVELIHERFPQYKYRGRRTAG